MLEKTKKDIPIMPPGLALRKQSLVRTTPVSNIYFYGSKGVRANEVLLCRHS